MTLTVSQQQGRVRVSRPLPGRSTGSYRDDSDVKFNLKYCSVVPDHVTQLAPRSRPQRLPRPASAARSQPAGSIMTAAVGPSARRRHPLAPN